MNKFTSQLQATVATLSAPGKGILAADESGGTIGKRFDALRIATTEDNRRAYRELLINTPRINEYIAGIILFEETLFQKTSTGESFPELLKKHNILPGIKVDKGLAALPNTHDEFFTMGLDGLAERLIQYREQGATFAKWRSVYTISDNTPSSLAMHANAEGLAAYAAICQANGIVPMVEPEILIDGKHSIEQNAEITENVLHSVFHALHRNKVSLELMILKPSMVISGTHSTTKATTEQVAEMTLRVLKRTVPAAVPTINFLSGGQSSEEATANLNAMHLLDPHLPWNLSYSYARALQDYCMKAWQGQVANVETAQKIFLRRAKLNSLACAGKYTADLEKELSTS